MQEMLKLNWKKQRRLQTLNQEERGGLGMKEGARMMT